MASRRTTPRKASGKGKKGKTRAQLKKLLKNAQTEIEKLLTGEKKGILTRANLSAGLKEIKKDLVCMEPLEKGG